MIWPIPFLICLLPASSSAKDNKLFFFGFFFGCYFSCVAAKLVYHFLLGFRENLELTLHSAADVVKDG